MDHSTRRSRVRPIHATLGTRLGNWVATIVVERGTAYIMAVAIGTNLTVVFPLEPQSDFRQRFGTAVATALAALDVPIELAARESAAIDHISLEYLRGGPLTEVLAYTKWFCQTEFMYHDDSAVVQSNLNALPRPKLGGELPEIAVRGLFAGPAPTAPLKLV